MPKTSIERIQDNVHGLMEFHNSETLVVDLLRTPEMQRLRRIKQLGLVNLIFPGAEHSRFTHSIGASYLSIKFAKQLKRSAQGNLADTFIPNEDAINDLAIATLCHDLGHGPLSHAWEKEIIGENFESNKEIWCKAYNLDISTLPANIKWHELITLAIISWDEGQLHKTLENHSSGMAERIKLMLTGNHYIPYLPQLISSDIDVDRADYIKRDAFMTGVAYGRYDLEWLISTCTLGEHQSNLVVGFDKRKSIRVVEQFLIARRALYDTVYHHKTVTAAEGMIKLLFTRLKDFIADRHISHLTNQDTVNMIINLVRGDVLDLQSVIRFDDNVIWSLIEQIGVITPFSEDKTLKDLSHRILTRDLFKLVNVDEKRWETYLEKKGMDAIHNIIERYTTCDSKYYLLIENNKYSTISSSNDSQSYLIDCENNRTAIPLKDMEEFSSFKKPSWSKRIYTVSEAVDDVRREIETVK